MTTRADQVERPAAKIAIGVEGDFDGYVGEANPLPVQEIIEDRNDIIESHFNRILKDGFVYEGPDEIIWYPVSSIEKLSFKRILVHGEDDG